MPLPLIPLQTVLDVNWFFETEFLAHYSLAHTFQHYGGINFVIHGGTCFIPITNISKKFVILASSNKPMHKI